MDIQQKQELIAYFAEFVTQNKKDKMDSVIVQRTRHVSLVLEDIYQPHNASAILRSAECFGVQDIHCVEDRNRFAATEGIALGASQWLTTQQHDTTKQCFDQLKKQGYRIIATTPHTKACSLPNLSLRGKMALVFGTEHTGLSEYALEHADEYVKIPMYGFTESFNVSVSVALCLYDVTQRLRTSNYEWKLSEEELIDVRLRWLRKIIRGSAQLEKRFFEQK